MRCTVCGEFVTREVGPPLEDDEEDVEERYIYHHAINKECLGMEVDSGSMDDQGPQLQFHAVDLALQIYFKDGIQPGHTWLDVQRHDLGRGGCRCASCVAVCKICQRRLQNMEEEAKK